MADETNRQATETASWGPGSNDVRYTNDDVPGNMYGTGKENPPTKEFGAGPASDGDGTDVTKVRYAGGTDARRFASTFLVVSIVAFAVVLDDSAFSEFFDPFTGIITESFGISDAGSAEPFGLNLVLTPSDTGISYSVGFDTVPEGNLSLVVRDGNSVVAESPLADAMSGTISGLAPGTTYRVSVTQDGKAIGAERSVSTLGVYDGAPLIRLLSAKNHNAVERNPDDTGGYFKFRIAVIDRNGVCSDFRAKLEFTNVSGFVIEGAFAGNPSDTQSLEILDEYVNGINEPLPAVLSITWNVSGSPTGLLTETVYI